LVVGLGVRGDFALGIALLLNSSNVNWTHTLTQQPKGWHIFLWRGMSYMINLSGCGSDKQGH
jgi:hypothetical protein